MPARRKYRTILLFGMPGSGKGTQGIVLGQLPDLVHISCGDIFRKLPKYGALGKEIVDYTSQGLLVPDDLTVRIWENHIRILAGDKVSLELSPYDLSKGRITFRHIERRGPN